VTEESGDPAVGEKEGTDRAKHQAPQIRQRHGEVIPVMNIKLGYFKTILKKHGNKYIKKFLWDNEFKNNKWNCIENTSSDLIYSYLEKYIKNGSILDLGCGSGNTGNELDFTAYKYYEGVDISKDAIEKAISRTRSNGRSWKNKYATADIMDYVPKEMYDVILFRESIFYFSMRNIKTMLSKYVLYLKHDGVFIVRIYNNKKYASILNLIEKYHCVLDKEIDINDNGTIVVFR